MRPSGTQVYEINWMITNKDYIVRGACSGGVHVCVHTCVCVCVHACV